MALPPPAKLKPHDIRANADEQGFKRALALFREAARRVPAYKKFLKKAKIQPELVRTKADFAQVPPTNKPNYVSRYSLEELSWDGSLDCSKYVSTSSGSSGAPLFWPRGARQDAFVGQFYGNILDDIFGARTTPTLVVDSFALGTWIAGLEFYNAARFAQARGSRLTLSTPGIDGREAVNQILTLYPYFKRILLVSYPPFAKDIIREGARAGIPWKKLDVRFLVAAEAASEEFKERLLSMAGASNDPARFVNVYGMADSGIVAHETPLSVLLRRSLKGRASAETGLPAYEDIAGMYQYYPAGRFFELGSEGSLLLTSDAGLPLVRYDTRDAGGLLPYRDAMERFGEELTPALRRLGQNPSQWRMPFVYLKGRKDFSVTLYGLNIFVESVKRAFERSPSAGNLSGLFTMEVGHTRGLNQQLRIAVELAPSVASSARLGKELEEEVVRELCVRNSEYAKLFSVIGSRARPKITFVPYGGIATARGKKHRWVKR